MNNFTLACIIILTLLWGAIVVSKIKVDGKCDYIIIVTFVLFFCFALSMEFTDLFCEQVDFSCKQCGDGLSASYIEYKPKVNTTKTQAIENIKDLFLINNSFSSSWRKYFIISCLIIFILFLYKKDLTCVDFIVIFISCFVVLQLTDNFYRYHYQKHVNDVVNENLDILKIK